MKDFSIYEYWHVGNIIYSCDIFLLLMFNLWYNITISMVVLNSAV